MAASVRAFIMAAYVSRALFSIEWQHVHSISNQFPGAECAVLLQRFQCASTEGAFLQPSTLNLPFGFHSINHTSGPAGAPTWSLYGMAVIDASGCQSDSWNGQISPCTFTQQVYSDQAYR